MGAVHRHALRSWLQGTLAAATGAVRMRALKTAPGCLQLPRAQGLAHAEPVLAAAREQQLLPGIGHSHLPHICPPAGTPHMDHIHLPLLIGGLCSVSLTPHAHLPLLVGGGVQLLVREAQRAQARTPILIHVLRACVRVCVHVNACVCACACMYGVRVCMCVYGVHR